MENFIKVEQNIRQLRNVHKVTEDEINVLIEMKIDLSNDYIVNLICLCKSKKISFFILAQFLSKSYYSDRILDTEETLERYNFAKNLIEQGNIYGRIIKTIYNYDYIYSSGILKQEQINKLLNYFKKEPIEDFKTVEILIKVDSREPDLVEKLLDIYSLGNIEKEIEFIGDQEKYIKDRLKKLGYNENEIKEYWLVFYSYENTNLVLSDLHCKLNHLQEVLINDFLDKYLVNLGFNKENDEVNWYKKRFIGDGPIEYIIKRLDLIINYTRHKNKINHIPDEIFDKNKIFEVLQDFGMIKNDKGDLEGISYELVNEYMLINSQIIPQKIYIKKDEIEKIQTMINIGNHRDFWKNLTPAEFIHCYEQYKYLLFETADDLNLKYYGFNGEEMFEQMITLREKNILTKEEIWQLNIYAGNILIADIKGLKNILNKFKTDEQLKLSRREGDVRRFDEVVLSDGTKLIEIIENFDKYKSKIDEYNEELKGKVYNNSRYLATTVRGNSVGFAGGSGIGWDVVLEKGSHALFLPTYTDHHQSELEYLIRPDNNIVFQIEITANGQPKIVGYVSTP